MNQIHEFTHIKEDGDRIVSPMPADETVVTVLLDNGETSSAWYSQDIMEAGDWDFVPVLADGEPDMEADSIADRVVGWRPV